MSIETELRILEENLLRPGFRHNRASVAALLADGFREFGSSGRTWTKRQILDGLEAEAPFKATINEFQAQELAPEVVLVTYIVTLQLSESESRTSLRSSVWILRAYKWQMLFHQGTVIPLPSSTGPSPELMEEVEGLPAQRGF